jgi:hypothetical protein
MPGIECEHCGKPFWPQNSRVRTCSSRCSQRRADAKRAAARARPKPEPRVCALDGCDVEFQPKTKLQTYCSQKHAQGAWHVRQRAARA